MTYNLIDYGTLDQAFRLLSGHLEDAGVSPLHLVVCGGSALIATGLLSRTTRDVDVVALEGPDGEFVTSRPLPEEIKPAILAISRDLGLMENWLNSGPADLFEMGMPEGFEDRLIKKTYGSHLTVSFIGRVDQIHFKLYASHDRVGGRHLDDLRALNPTDEEIETAARWTMTHDVSEGFRIVLIDMLRKIGYEAVAARI